MADKKVLIITYYWPPSGGSGVQRWLKFVKYIPSFGWEPYVFTPENPSFDIRDESLVKDVPVEAEVIRFPIWEPYSIFIRLSSIFGRPASARPTDLVATGKRSLFQQISMWLRGNLFIPDPRRFWIKPSVSFLHDFIHDNKIRTIITTGPPHSVHLIGYRLKKKNRAIRWLADFRDPWSQWGLLDSLNTSAAARWLHRRLESAVLSTADEIITITPFYVRQFQTLSQRKVRLLTNGYDEDDFKDVVIHHTDMFVIRHVGIINEKCNPRPFLLALKQIMQEDTVFAHAVRLEFNGEVHPQIKSFIQTDDDLSKVAVFTGNISHQELMAVYGQSSLLLLILTGYKDAEGYLPGKLFEYMATGIPVLGVGPVQGDAADVLATTQAGVMVSEDGEEIKNVLKRQFELWQQPVEAKCRVTAEVYSRRAITQSLTELL